MKSIRNIAVSLLALLGLVVMPLAASTTAARARGEAPGLFDYYVLSLSWSPTYCLSKKGRRDRKQCRPGAGHGFVIHGLWPQFRRGWPSQCRGAARFVPDRVIREVLDVMPSRGLVIHEWRKHGTCSGLSPRAYFALAEKLFRRINIPRAYLRPATALRRAPRQIREDFARPTPAGRPTCSPPCARAGEAMGCSRSCACASPPPDIPRAAEPTRPAPAARGWSPCRRCAENNRPGLKIALANPAPPG